MPPIEPVRLDETSTTWFSAARDRSSRSNRPDSQRAGRFGEGLVVVDHQADPPDRGVERREPVARGIDAALGRWLVDLAMPAQYAVAGDAERGVVPVVAVGLAEPEAHHHLTGHRDHLGDQRIVEAERWREIGRRLVRAEIQQVAAECGVGQHQQLHLLPTPVPDERLDPGEIELEIPREPGRHCSDLESHSLPPLRSAWFAWPTPTTD
jgi:hypothetical protein